MQNGRRYQQRTKEIDILGYVGFKIKKTLARDLSSGEQYLATAQLFAFFFTSTSFFESFSYMREELKDAVWGGGS